MVKRTEAVEALERLRAFCLTLKDEVDAETGKAITGEMKAELFANVRAAVESYYDFDGVLRSQVMYLITQAYSDWMKRNTVYEDAPCQAAYSEDYPRGYFDITGLFRGGGSLPELLKMSEDDFVKAFEVKAGVLGNPLVEKWVKQLTAARAGELADIETLLNFCKDAGQSNGLIVAFESYGKAVNTKTKQEAAQELYGVRNYKMLIQEFSLGVYIPSYM